MKDRFSLSELNGTVKKVLSANFNAPVWVVGEISEINIHSNGHCYLMLIEKGETEDRIIAQARATIWSYTFRMLRPFFETSTGQQLTDGIKVLLQVSVEFHELYGFSLNVRNIDPNYTLGDQARKRKEIIKRLTDEGVFTMNKELELPLVPQKIAIISSSTAAGYQDFMNQLANNSNGYQFYTKLFPALMQGNLAEQSITNALDRIFPYEDFFDVVVIIRGGGSQSDLSCFDNYNLAFHVTQFPIPVLTGIGHEKDDSIVDLVAHTRLKTPTAVAEFILNGVEAFEERIEQIQNEVVGLTKDRLRDEKARLDRITREVSYEIRSKLESRKKDLMNMTWRFQHEIRLTLQERKHWLEKKMQRTGLLIDRFIFVKQQKLETVQDQANQIVKRKIKKEKLRLAELPELLKHRLQRKLDLENHRLELADQKAKLFDPANVLKRGYSITVYDGGLVKDLSLIKQSELITTRLYKGSLISKVLKINQSDNNDN